MLTDPVLCKLDWYTKYGVCMFNEKLTFLMVNSGCDAFNAILAVFLYLNRESSIC